MQFVIPISSSLNIIGNNPPFPQSCLWSANYVIAIIIIEVYPMYGIVIVIYPLYQNIIDTASVFTKRILEAKAHQHIKVKGILDLWEAKSIVK